jgi:hypothetical protein
MGIMPNISPKKTSKQRNLTQNYEKFIVSEEDPP